MKPFTKVLIGAPPHVREEELSGGHDANSVWREEVKGTDFAGHRILWGFSYQPYTYLKESELSGDEYRKGGTVRFTRNNVQVFEDFCREPENAILRIGGLLHRLMDLDWAGIVVGKKLYWRDTPCVISMVILEQGAMVLKVDGAERFPDAVWAVEDWSKLEDPTKVKVDFLDPHIWWTRNPEA